MFSLIFCSLVAGAAKVSTATWILVGIQGAKVVRDICKEDK